MCSKVGIPRDEVSDRVHLANVQPRTGCVPIVRVGLGPIPRCPEANGTKVDSSPSNAFLFRLEFPGRLLLVPVRHVCNIRL